MAENSLSTSFVIFGASGDLTQRKLIPALFNLYRKGRLPENFRILGFAYRPWDDHTFRSNMHSGVEQFADYKFQQTEWENFAGHLHYLPGNFTNLSDFDHLANYLAGLEGSPTNRLFYLATAPGFFLETIYQLSRAGLTKAEAGWRRVVIEKPFGTDLDSARALNHAVHRVFDESQIYRIDHYLGKETVQNLLVFRFANSIFEPVWNRQCIDHVQITVAEEVGVEHRAGYYDGVGVLRDMFQNHLFQLLSLVAMEPPATYKGDALRDEKVKVIKSVRPIATEEMREATVRGQYRGYREEPGVAPDSQTETYAAIRLFIDNWRWQGVPFYLRSGKRMAEKCTEILVQFKYPPLSMFPLPSDHEMTANILTLCLQPDEGIHLRFEAKVPDTIAEMRSVEMEFHYRDSFGPTSIPEAYERLLLDALIGDQSLFTRDDRTELTWEIIDPIINTWHAADSPTLTVYEPGSWGPVEADEFLAHGRRTWLRGCGGHQKTAS